MIRTLSIALLVAAALLPIGARAQSKVTTFTTLTNLLHLDPRSVTQDDQGAVLVLGETAVNDWGQPRLFWYDIASTASTNRLTAWMPENGIGRWRTPALSTGGGGGGGTATNAQPVFATISDAVASTSLVFGDTIRVLNYSTTQPWYEGRDFKVTNSIPAWGTNVGNTFETAGGLVILAKDATSDRLLVEHWGMVGDDSTDNAVPLAAIVRHASTNAVEIVFHRGIYRTSFLPRFNGNFPLKLSSSGGSYRTGWNPTNAISESRLVYTGPATNRFVEFKPTVGFIYGLNIEGITFDAQGLAAESLHLERVTRGRLQQIRCINATDRDCVVENCYDLVIENYSSSANEMPFVVPTRIGIALTNQANGNQIIAPTISGVSEVAVDISDRSKVNTISAGAIESNSGASVRVRVTADRNSISGIWHEANGATNWIQIDDGVLGTVVDDHFLESPAGNMYFGGAYGRMSGLTVSNLTFGASSSHNRLQDTILGVGLLPTGNWEDQILDNVIDATSLLRTNSRPDNQSIRGEVFDIYRRGDQYPMTRLGRSSILFGDGTSGLPSVGIYRASAASLGFSNTIFMVAGGGNDGLISARVTNEVNSRVQISMPGIISIGDGVSPPDTRWQRSGQSNWLTDSSVTISRPTTNHAALVLYSAGAAAGMMVVYPDGSIEWGPPAGPRDAFLARVGPGILKLRTNLQVQKIELNGVDVSTTLSNLAAQATNLVDISVGSMTLSNALPIGSGGTSATNPAQARAALGALGTNAVLNELAASNGASVTNLNGTEVRTGTVAEPRIDTAIARLSGPTFTSDPKAPTASPGDNDTSIATTAFVAAAVAAGGGGGGGSTTNLKVNGSWVTNANLSSSLAPTRGQSVQWNTSSGDVAGWVEVRRQIPLLAWFQPPTNFLLWTTTNANPIGWGNDSNSWALRYSGFIPSELAAMPSQLTVVSWWKLYAGNSASQNIVVGARVMRALGGDDADSFGTQSLATNVVTAAGTWFSVTNVISSLDSLAIGEPFTLEVENTAASASSTFTNNVAFRGAEIRYQ